MQSLAEAMSLIFRNELLPAGYLDHELSGDVWGGARELHVGGDFLLVYRLHHEQNLVTFLNIGTHSELFG